MQNQDQRVISVLGGTGNEGYGLALRWASVGYPVIIGSRSASSAAETATRINAALEGRSGTAQARGCSNFDAAQKADIVALSVPYAVQQSLAKEVSTALTGKILIDVTVPLKPPKVRVVQLPEAGSAVLAVQQQLGDQVRVVSAFQNISAHHLCKLDEDIECEVLVCSDNKEAADLVVELSRAIGITAWNGGALANSAVAEGLTSILISLNKRYKVPGSGIRITGIPENLQR